MTKSNFKLFREMFRRSEIIRCFEERVSGSKTVGVDGVSPLRYSDQLTAEATLVYRRVRLGVYRFSRYKPKLISKGPAKPPRTISVPTVRDRTVLRILFEYISIIFRDRHTPKPHWYIDQIENVLKNDPQDLDFVRIDVVDFYPSISVVLLMREIEKRIKVSSVLKLIRSAVEGKTHKHIESKGLPQGLSISNILASVYLTNEDEVARSMFSNYFRYVDDILVIAPRLISGLIFLKIELLLAAKNLKVHSPYKLAGKSQISPVEDGVDYLGFRISREMISVRRSSYEKIFKSIADLITNEIKRGIRIQRLIWRINLKITGCIYNHQRFGWLMFFAKTKDVSQLMRLDSYVQSQLGRVKVPLPEKPVKTFIRSYFEIKFNIRDSTYVPNFDLTNISEMKSSLVDVGWLDGDIVDILSDDNIRGQFKKLIKKETSELEKDLVESFS